jgi:hypothetical protein
MDCDLAMGQAKFVYVVLFLLGMAAVAYLASLLWPKEAADKKPEKNYGMEAAGALIVIVMLIAAMSIFAGPR